MNIQFIDLKAQLEALGGDIRAGIDRVLTRLHDGQRVEVDGTAGVVRVLSPDD